MTGESNVIAMPGYSVPTPYGTPVTSVVEIMREYLAKAESGELRAIALACVCAASESDVRVDDDFAAGGGHSWALAVSIGKMSRRFYLWLDE